MVARLALVAICGLLAACGFLDSERPAFGVSNGTTLAIVVTINSPDGGMTINVGPRGSAEIDATKSPALPWAVEARTESGRLLASMTVVPGQVFRRTLPDGSVQTSAALGRADLACGRFDMWAGLPSGGPAPGPGCPATACPRCGQAWMRPSLRHAYRVCILP